MPKANRSGGLIGSSEAKPSIDGGDRPTSEHLRSRAPGPRRRRWRDLISFAVLRRGLSREEAAARVGVSPTTFDRMVRDELMPKPIRIYGRTVWDIHKIDAAFDALDSAADEVDAWGDMRA